MTEAEQVLSSSRRDLRPSFASAFTLQKIRGRREDRVPAAPAAPCAKIARKAHTGITTGKAESPAFPAQWFYGLLRALPGEPACLPPSQATMRQHRGRLGACMGAPGPHDFAVRKRCRSSIDTSASTATRLACRDDRDTPLRNRGGMHRQYGKSEFLERRKFA